MQLRQVGERIWTYEGSTVSFYGFPYPTRMTVIKLANNGLWIHSPERLNDALRQELDDLGEVKYLISPNKLHHLFLPEWIEAYPEAITYAAPGLMQKRKDIKFARELTDNAEPEWVPEIAQVIFRGSRAMEEVVFYHKPSRTLIVTDLIENFRPDSLNWGLRMIAWMAGILYPHGKMPIDWRLSFALGGKQKARVSFATILGWQPENIILSHGECIYGGGAEFMKQSFSWLQKGT